MFSIGMWNCFEAASQGLQKTNNDLEGWHRGFATAIGICHANLWKFIEVLKKEYEIHKADKILANAGQPARLGRKKYRDLALRVKTCLERYDDQNDVILYLRGIAHNL